MTETEELEAVARELALKAGYGTPAWGVVAPIILALRKRVAELENDTTEIERAYKNGYAQGRQDEIDNEDGEP